MLYKLRKKVASHARHDEPVKLVVSSVSSRAVRAVLYTAKCMGSTRRTCWVVLCRDVTSQVEFGL